MDEPLDDLDASYQRQLAQLKPIILRLACPQQVQLCSVWIERFTSCGPQEEDYRSMLVNMFVRQLRNNGRLGEPFVAAENVTLSLQDIVEAHTNELVRFEQRQFESNDSGLGGLTKEDDADLDEITGEEKYSRLCDKVNQVLARFEYHLMQIGASDRPLEQLKRLHFMTILDLCQCDLGINFRPIVDRVQRRWMEIFERIDTKNQPRRAESSSASSVSSSTSTGLDRCGDLCTDLHHLSAACLSDQGSSSKYKKFAIKCAKRMEKMKAEIEALKQAAQIQASTESIRFAALKSELVQRTGAKQQAEMCAMIDQLDERYREIIAKSMALGVAESSKKVTVPE